MSINSSVGLRKEGYVTSSGDLAPVHSTVVSLKKNNFSSDKSISNGCRAKNFANYSNMPTDFNEKLPLKNGLTNGITLDVTNVELHCVPSSVKQKISLACESSFIYAAECNNAQTIQKESFLGCKVRDLSDSNSSYICKKLEEVSLNETCSELKNGGESNKKPHTLAQQISDSQSYVESKENFAEVVDSSQGNISGPLFCNGHIALNNVSETTSSNSIATSDLSVSSDKLSDFIYSGAGAKSRTKTAHQSVQFKSDLDSSSSESCLKTPEISVCPAISNSESEELHFKYVNYENEKQMNAIMSLIQKDLSEPYSIYTYRYFIHNWPKLCFLALCGEEVVGAIVCKLDVHKKVTVRGYIAMLAVNNRYRKRKIGTNLVQCAIRAMIADDADEVVLETEITNKPALKLYENLGFVRDKRLFRYYLNGVDALRLKLWLR